MTTTTPDLERARADRSLIERALTDAGAHIEDPKKFNCPFHEDRNPSAGLYQSGENWKFKCHGCDVGGDVFDIVQRARGVDFRKAREMVLGVNGSPTRTKGRTDGRDKPKRLYGTPDDAVRGMLGWPVFKGGRHASSWTYENADGSVAFMVLRFDFEDGGKQFRPIHPVGDMWAVRAPPGLLPLYRLPEVREAVRRGDTIYIVEGEKCADALWAIGIPATTSAHGAKSAAKTDWTPLATANVVILPDADDSGEWYAKTVTQTLLSLDPPATVRIVRLPDLPPSGDIINHLEHLECRDDSDIRHGIEELAGAAECATPKVTKTQPVKQELVIVKLSDVIPAAQPYLWAGRIPSSSCTLIGGRQSATKNLFAYDVISRVTTGSPWPDDHAGPQRAPQSVILLEAEEHLESSIVTRLAASGADLDRIVYVKGAPTQNPDRTRLISIQRDADGIDQLALQLGDVGLVVVSPITSYLGSVEQNSNEQVRNEIIYPLKTLSETLGCAVVILKHPNKDWRNADPLERIGGSAAWTEAMRCVVFIGKDPDEDVDEKNPRRCAHWIKFSIGPTPEPLSWRVCADSGTPTISYLTDPVTFSASEMLVGSRKSEERKSKREHAAEWITKTLERGPMTAAALKDAAMTAVARDRQFSMDSFERARKDMRDAKRLVFQRKPETNPAEWWYWLDDQSAPGWYARGGDTEAYSADSSRA